MAKRPDSPCAGGCGRLLWRGRGSLPRGEATCRDCRTAALMRPCRVCGASFKALGRDGLPRAGSCSPACARVLQRKDPRVSKNKRSQAQNAAHCARRRARIEGAVREVVVPMLVFERDGWRCHLCGDAIDPALSGRHRMGPTLDHIVPLILDGEHSYANVKAAHRSCNSAKGARLAG